MTVEELQAEIAEWKDACAVLLSRCDLKTKPHLSFGPERFVKRLSELIGREDHGKALARLNRFRDALQRISAYPRLNAEEMALVASQAFRDSPPN